MEKKVESLIQLRNFNNSGLQPGCHRDVKHDSVIERKLKFTLRIETLTNCLNNENVGFRIRMEFSKYELFHVLTFVSVIDASGNRRFLRSFLEPTNSEFRVPRRFTFIEVKDYISRDSLLSKSVELLPDDCLTMQYVMFCVFEADIAEVISNLNYQLHFKSLVESSFDVYPDLNGEKCKLDLNSKMAKCLHAESSVFRDMLHSETFENDTRYLELPRAEAINLAKLCTVIDGGNIKDLPLQDFSDLCILADKYDVAALIKPCKDYIRSLYSITNLPLILMHIQELIPKLTELVTIFDDDCLKEIIEKSQKAQLFYAIKAQFMEIKWSMKQLKRSSPFKFMQTKENIMQDRTEYDFYC